MKKSCKCDSGWWRYFHMLKDTKVLTISVATAGPRGAGVGSSEPAEELLWENSYAEGGGCLTHKESLIDNPLQNRRP